MEEEAGLTTRAAQIVVWRRSRCIHGRAVAGQTAGTECRAWFSSTLSGSSGLRRRSSRQLQWASRGSAPMPAPDFCQDDAQRRSRHVRVISALSPNVDISQREWHFRYVRKGGNHGPFL